MYVRIAEGKCTSLTLVLFNGHINNYNIFYDQNIMFKGHLSQFFVLEIPNASTNDLVFLSDNFNRGGGGTFEGIGGGRSFILQQKNQIPQRVH